MSGTERAPRTVVCGADSACATIAPLRETERLMVIRTADNGLTWCEPPFTPEEEAIYRRALSGAPIAIYRRRETPAEGSTPPAAEGSDAAQSPTPKRP